MGLGNGKTAAEWTEELEHFFALTIDLLCIADLSGNILRINRAWEETLGYKTEELEGRRFMDFVHPDDRASTEQAVQRLAEGQNVTNFVNRYRCRDNSYRYLEWRAYPHQNRLIYSVARDITERRKAEERARGENAFRRAIIDRAAEGLCVCHGLDAPPYIRFIVWNDRMTEITGYTMEEINQRGWYQTVYSDPEISARAQERMARMREGDDLRGEEWEIIRKDGGHRVIAISTKVIQTEDQNPHVLAMMYDLTARKEAEEALRRSEVRLRSIFRASPVGIGLVRDRVLVQVNERICEITGYTEQELIGKSARVFYPSDEEFEAVGREKYDQIRRLGFGSVETRFKRKDGRVIDVLLSSVPLDPSDLLAGVTFTALDITEGKHAEAERRKMEAQVQHVQKLESLGILAGGIAHDFNNLLMAILGNTDLAQRVLSPASPGQPFLRDIETASRRAAELCRQMLAYSGKGRFVIQTLDVNEIVEEMTRMMEVSISKKAVLKYNLTRGLPCIEADAVQIRQILMNLITNASEAIEERSGIISIATGALRCDRDYLTETYLAENLPEGVYVYVEVADTGCGMTPEVQSKMFDPFFTTKFTGRGLGMAAVLGIVRGHQGAIKIYSEPGKGTTIKALIPASPKTVLTKEEEESDEREWKGQGTVLVVDDEESLLTVTGQMLEMMGFRVVTARDGREAIRTYGELRGEIVCVLMDLTMPRVDGEEAYRELRRIERDVRVIMTSGYNEQEVTQRFVGKGLAGFLQKPFLYKTLLAKLREVLEKRVSH